MNDEQKIWREQYWTNSWGVREFTRIGCAFFIWQGIGIGLTIWSGNIGYVLVCVAIYFSFPILSMSWQPAYSVLRKIIGNNNLPTEMMPRNRKWWSYIPLAIRLVISIVLLIKGIEFLIT